MKIIVCIAKTPDTTTKIGFTDNNTKLNTENIQWIINPLDEFALTRALEIKEAAASGTVVVIHVGGVDTEPVIRKALALGADAAVRIDAEPTDTYYVATQLAHYIKEEGYHFILTGRETIDYNGSQVGGMIAELLGIPFISAISKLDIKEKDNEATMERQIDGGKEVLTVKLPFVASVQEGIAIPRIPNMRGIMSARTKPLKVVMPIEAEKLTSVQLYELPKPKGQCKIIDANKVEELVELLHKEAKVI